MARHQPTLGITHERTAHMINKDRPAFTSRTEKVVWDIAAGREPPQGTAARGAPPRAPAGRPFRKRHSPRLECTERTCRGVGRGGGRFDPEVFCNGGEEKLRVRFISIAELVVRSDSDAEVPPGSRSAWRSGGPVTRTVTGTRHRTWVTGHRMRARPEASQSWTDTRDGFG